MKINVSVRGNDNFLVRQNEIVYTDENGKRVGEVFVKTEGDKLELSVSIDLLDMPMEFVKKIQDFANTLHIP